MEVEKINLRNQFDQGSKNLEQKFTTFFLIKFSKFSKIGRNFEYEVFNPKSLSETQTSNLISEH